MQPQLTSLVSEVLDIPEDRISGDLGPESSDEWDSLNHLRLMTAVEDEFGIKLSMDEIQEIRDLERLDALIRAKTGAS